MTSGEPPPGTGSDPAVLFSRYLDFYRDKAVEKVTILAPEEQVLSRVPSLWTPLQLLNHLAHMERRWFVWGFLAEPVEDPFGDEVDGVWRLPAGHGAQEVVAMAGETGERTRAVLASYPLDTVASTGGRFDHDPPTLSWICFHVLQEYARHVGHLDIVTELAGGPTGE